MKKKVAYNGVSQLKTEPVGTDQWIEKLNLSYI